LVKKLAFIQQGFNISNVSVKTFSKYCSFELSIHQRIQKFFLITVYKFNKYIDTMKLKIGVMAPGSSTGIHYILNFTKIESMCFEFVIIFNNTTVFTVFFDQIHALLRIMLT